MATIGEHQAGIATNIDYCPINVSFLGKQKITFTELSLWRNNLVAASRCYNYVFLALRSQIHVYQPMYPSQIFPEKPLYILDSEPSTSLSGYIDPRYPHAINSLTIGDLGIEEVLVSAHDNGDICLWYTRDLTKIAIRRNVGISAWGVALHKEKRLLAVSANSRHIYVFDLGVRSEGPKRDEGSGTAIGSKVVSQSHGLSNSNGNSDSATPIADKDVSESEAIEEWGNNPMRVLKGHENNIPSISFLDDPSGNWLVGTSIDGRVIVWDIEKEEKAAETELGPGPRERGWTVSFLRPECFLPTRDEYQGLGMLDEIMTIGGAYNISTYLGTQADGYFVDSDDTGDSGSYGGGSDEGLETEDYEEDDDDVVSDDYIQNELHFLQHELSEMESPLDQSMDEAGDDNDESWDESDSLFGNNETQTSISSVLDFATHGEGGSPNVQPESRVVLDTIIIPVEHARRNVRPPPQLPPPQQFPLLPSANLPQSFIFSTSEHSVRLLDVPCLENMVVCQHALHPPPSRALSDHIDRLNMISVIPELSMVVVANQTGQVAIFRLTQNEAGYMMRLDELIPQEPSDDELSNDRSQLQPCRLLLGMAVGPVQGREFGRYMDHREDMNTSREADPNDAAWEWRNSGKKKGVWRSLEKRRRYRLILVYTDGSIFSYELGGMPDSEISICTVDGGYVMV